MFEMNRLRKCIVSVLMVCLCWTTVAGPLFASDALAPPSLWKNKAMKQALVFGYVAAKPKHPLSSRDAWAYAATLVTAMGATLQVLSGFGNRAIADSVLCPGSVFQMMRGGIVTFLPPSSMILGLALSMAFLAAFHVAGTMADWMELRVKVAMTFSRYPELVSEMLMTGVFTGAGAMLGFSFAGVLIHSFGVAMAGGALGSALGVLIIANMLRQKNYSSSLLLLLDDVADAWSALPEQMERLAVQYLRQRAFSREIFWLALLMGAKILPAEESLSPSRVYTHGSAAFERFLTAQTMQCMSL